MYKYKYIQQHDARQTPVVTFDQPLYAIAKQIQWKVTTARTADSFLRAAHVARTRRAHQVTATAIYILQ